QAERSKREHAGSAAIDAAGQDDRALIVVVTARRGGAEDQSGTVTRGAAQPYVRPRTALDDRSVDRLFLPESRQLPESETDADGRNKEDQGRANDPCPPRHRASGAPVLFTHRTGSSSWLIVLAHSRCGTSQTSGKHCGPSIRSASLQPHPCRGCVIQTNPENDETLHRCNAVAWKSGVRLGAARGSPDARLHSAGRQPCDLLGR